MTPELTRIIEKIKLLRQKANGNQNEHELNACVLAADKLISLHRITEAQIEATDITKAEPMVKATIEGFGKRMGWMETIIGSLCLTYGGAWYLSSHRGECVYTICAKKGDADLIQYFFIYCVEAVDALAEVLCKGKGIRYSAAWRIGAADGLAVQFANMRKERKAATELAKAIGGGQSAALVLLSNRADEAKSWMYDNTPGLGNRASRLGGASDANAYRDGKARGETMSIRRGINGNGGRGPNQLGS